jgi:hypothetical protein
MRDEWSRSEDVNTKSLGNLVRVGLAPLVPSLSVGAAAGMPALLEYIAK